MDGARAAALEFELLAEAWLDWGGSCQKGLRSDRTLAKELSWIACVASEAGKLRDPREEGDRQGAIFGSLKQVLLRRVGREAWDRERMGELVSNEAQAELFGGWCLRGALSQALGAAIERGPEQGASPEHTHGERMLLLARARQKLLAPSVAGGLVNASLEMLRMLPGVIDDALTGMRALHERGVLSVAAGAPSLRSSEPTGLRL